MSLVAHVRIATERERESLRTGGAGHQLGETNGGGSMNGLVLPSVTLGDLALSSSASFLAPEKLLVSIVIATTIALIFG